MELSLPAENSFSINDKEYSMKKTRPRSASFSAYLLIAIAALFSVGILRAEERPALKEVRLVSSLDGNLQPVRLSVPENARSKPTPLLLFLHSWSGNYAQNNSKWQQEAFERGWIYLHPDFRGPNNSLKACGSKFARQDVLDSLDYVLKNFQVDRSRIYLAGSSGGGHMAMLMAGHHPERFSAVSAWVGISDLADWYRFHTKNGEPQRYAKMILASLGAAPGTNPDIDLQYKDRSPIFHLHKIGNLPIDLNAGVNDGHSGSVPIYHTMRAYNVIAKASGGKLISENEMNQLWNHQRLTTPTASDKINDKSYSRKIYLRRNSGPARITIFEGGHESLPQAACTWLAKQRRNTKQD